MIKLKFIKKLTNSTLLVEVTKKTYSDFLIEQKYFYNLKIKTYSYKSLDSSNSIMRSLDLSLCTKDEIKSKLCK